MLRKGEAELDDPYELIRRLRAQLQQKRQTIEDYNMIYESAVSQKNAALHQASRLRKQNEHLSRKVEMQALNKSNITKTSQTTQDLLSSKQIKEYKSLQLPIQSPTLKKSLNSSNIILLQTPSSIKKKETKTKEFVPHQVQFTKKRHINTTMNAMNESASEVLHEAIGDFLIQDFLMIGPDVQEFKKKRQALKEQMQIKVGKFTFFNFNKTYTQKKQQYLKDVANRCYPLGAQAKKHIVQNLEEFKTQMQYSTDGKMCQDVFILNLKGDFYEPPHSERVFLGNCNPFRALFAVCLKIPDFIPIKDEKHYQRSEQQVWKVQKVYALLTYYPFLNIHLSILSKIHNTLKPQWHNLHREDIFAKNLTRNMTEAQKNDQIYKIANYFMCKIPDFNQVCLLQKYYYGTLPNFGKDIQYSLPRFACSIFFSIFAYEQALLLISALFLEKTIIFVGRNESAATLCALFLVTCISPFVYNHHLILNCNEEMIENIVFGFPLPLVATLKKDSSNFPSILTSFIENSINHFRGFQGQKESCPLILIDMDSNSIFYDHELSKIFEKVIVEPSKQFRQTYHLVNSSHSKSFTFPKKMPVQISSRPKNDFQKNAQEKKKLLREYQQKIDNNMSKWPTFKVQDCHLQLLDMLTDYIRSFSIERDKLYQIVKLGKDNQVYQARQYLMKKHADKQHLIEVITGSQIFADYLDQLQKNFHFYN